MLKKLFSTENLLDISQNLLNGSYHARSAFTYVLSHSEEVKIDIKKLKKINQIEPVVFVKLVERSRNLLLIFKIYDEISRERRITIDEIIKQEFKQLAYKPFSENTAYQSKVIKKIGELGAKFKKPFIGAIRELKNEKNRSIKIEKLKNIYKVIKQEKNLLNLFTREVFGYTKGKTNSLSENDIEQLL